MSSSPGQGFSLRGHRALVTGGSVSIGRAIALGFAGAGADVAIQYAPEADAASGLSDAHKETCAAIEARGSRSVALAADFARPGEARRAVTEAAGSLGGLDVLVICASVQIRQDLVAVDRAALDEQVAINLASTFELLQAALPRMVEGGWGRVLSIGSVNAIRPDPQLCVYAALKAAQHSLIGGLARQYAAHGVTLNTLSPGLVATERNRWRREDPERWAEIEARANPMGRAGTPDEMVGAALMFCSDAGSFITGSDLQVTGGAHL